jgi:hypothetical protein
LTFAEETQARELIHMKNGERRRLEVQHRQLQAKLASLQSHRSECHHKIQERQYFLSTIRLLPKEVLSMLFLCLVEGLKLSPWTLMHVNRTWRSVASSTHALWKGIMITGPGWRENGSERRRDGKEICGSLQQLQLALGRAKNSPLELTVLGDMPRKPRQSLQSNDQEIFHAISDMMSFMHT